MARIREKTLEREDMLGEEVVAARKNSFLSTKEQEASVARLLGPLQGVARSPSPRRRMARSATQVPPSPATELPPASTVRRSSSLRSRKGAGASREGSARRNKGEEMEKELTN